VQQAQPLPSHYLLNAQDASRCKKPGEPCGARKQQRCRVVSEAIQLQTLLLLQVAKLLITPCTCLMEMLAVGKKVTPGITASIAMVVAGVAVV
jgi:hypothetical protein